MILLQVSAPDETKFNRYTHTTPDPPVCYGVVHQLHALRRVNCTFNHEIMRHPLLSQRMLLTPTPRDTARNDVVHALRPLRWFLGYTGLGEIDTHALPDYRDGLVNLPVLSTHDLASSLSTNFLNSINNAEASWKKLPLLEVPVEFGITITINIKFAIGGPRAGGLYRRSDQRCYMEEIVVCYEDGWTLGDFWSYLMRYVEMDKKSHWRNFREWQTREGLVEWDDDHETFGV
jgi:hypothetical protein